MGICGKCGKESVTGYECVIETTGSNSHLIDGLSCEKVKKEYILDIIDRKTGKVVQTETRKSEQAFDRLWGQAMTNVNTLKYKLKAR